MDQQQPVFKHGKICYVEIPALDIQIAVEFYTALFGWQVSSDAHGFTTFDDGTGGVGGMWVKTDAPVHTQGGPSVSIMVDDAEQTLKDIVANGGTIVEPIGKYFPEIMARFADPTGNVWTIYQHGGAE